MRARRRRSKIRNLAASGMAAALIGVVPIASSAPAQADPLPTGCLAVGTTVTCTYASTGAAQTFTPPAGVMTITVTASGGSGGKGGGGTFTTGAAGGLGGTVTGTISVTPSQPLTVDVGAAGADGTDGGSGVPP
ncbi:MAG TPA: hypothetical protein VHA73_08775, partial [Acidimicrobiales bacterium]|nr:hypothetical protein [Acidimicrobiales bacterium]